MRIALIAHDQKKEEMMIEKIKKGYGFENQ